MSDERRVMFVSGGSRGIGAGLVRGAAAAGLDVAFTYRTNGDAADAVRRQALDSARGATVRAYELDVRDPDAVERIGDAVLDEFGHVDVVVANAGVTRVGLAFATTNEDWREVIDTNLSGAFWVTRHFLASMIARRWGRIVYVSSVAANGMTGDPAYCASKAGLLGLTKAMAKEYGRKGVTANALILGLFETDMTAEGVSDRNRSFYETYCPVGRPGRIDEVTAMVLHLTRNESGFINGQTLGLTGGLDWYQ
jgi:NAD(P)-dependent dehydrogenase (short-subunit alcohol dehydrogenase family)